MGGKPKRIVKKAVKKVKKIVPKEVKPILPAVAAVYGPLALAKYGTAAGAGAGFGAKTLSAMANLPVGVQSAIINAATQGAVSGKIDPKEAAISGITSQLGSKLASTTTPATTSVDGMVTRSATANPTFLEKVGTKLAPSTAQFKQANALQKAGILTTAATPAASYAAGRELKELNEQMIRDYEASLNKGVGPDEQEGTPIDKDTRRSMIFGYFTNAGYEPGYVNTILDKYGYADGGRVGFGEGGQVTISREEYEDLKRRAGEGEGIASIDVKNLGDLQESLGGIMSGYQMATGQSLVPQPARIPTGIVPGFGNMPRVGKAEGGMMDLGNKEMDVRDGGFIPIGAKEKADDVPARLSKNEFVMTADAVRGAGNGSVERGAKRMYDLMNKLETKV